VERIARIGKNIYRGISRLKARIKYFLLPNVWFEEIGFTYLGPIDGHDIGALIRVLENAKGLEGPVVIHAVTQKGRGYGFAECSPDKFHGIGAFDPRTGYVKCGSTCTNSDVLGMVLCDLAQKDKKIAAITAAMSDGTGLRDFSMRYPARFFDVAIAEQHAVTMAAGLAAAGMKPVVAIYSSFLQRAYDQILHDVALQGLPVVFAVDRAGLVGEDGETHQGVYDLVYLQTIPGLDIYAPATMEELAQSLKLAIASGRPAAVRYPRGALMNMPILTPVERGKWDVVCALRPITIVAAGKMVQTAMEAMKGLDVGLVNARCIAPLDMNMIDAIRETCRCIVTAEDGLKNGGLGSRLCEALSGSSIEIIRVGVGKKPVPQASAARQHAMCGM
ncbi:MAG: 1-deoxy-D-xylulose-5-phosphate synthase, partial [Clostridia bacterium]|nr:1-deoxy-D-xylulose-5-phosphate synthase [Clostridia bacterium]